MEEITQEQPDKNLEVNKNPLPDTQKEVVTNNVDKTPNQEISDSKSQQDTPSIQKENNNVVVEKNNHKHITTADKIAFVGLIINLVMTIFTYLLFKETTNATKISNSAVDEARRSNSISEKNYELAKNTFEESKKSGEEASQIAKKSINTQVNSIKETQRQFEINNEPFLNISSYEVVKFEDKKLFSYKLKIENLGKYPCKVIKCKTVTAIKIVPPPFKEIYTVNPNYSDILNKYIINGNPIQPIFESDKPTSTSQFDVVSNKNYFIYTTGFITYKNIINNRIKTYNFQIKAKPGYDSEYIINENIKN